MPHPNSPCCVSLNNEAVELFQKGAYLQAAKILRGAVNTFLEIIPDAMDEDELSEKSPHVSIDNTMHRWSDKPWPFSSTQESIFVHRRAAFLCPASFCLERYCLYCAFMLYNLALCYQHMSITAKGVGVNDGSRLLQSHGTSTTGVFDDKAHHLYSMALGALQKSPHSDGVFLTVLLNNTGQLLYQQSMTYEATRCFRVVRDLMNADDSKDLFEKGDYCGLYLNSLIVSDTASAA